MSYANYYIQSDKTTFLQAVNNVAAKLGVTSEDLLAVMMLESSLIPSAVNKYTGASGLIQFMPATAKALGTTVEDIRQMTGTEQMEYVYKFLKQYASKINNFYDLYLAIFYPYALGKPNTFVLGSQTSATMVAKIAQQNPRYDINKDGQITVAEVKQAITDSLNLKKKIVLGSSITLIGVTIAVGVALLINSYYNNLE